MASEYSYEGLVNGQHGFRELASGTFFVLPAGVDSERLELLDGDEVAITSGSVRQVWSVRGQHVVRSDFV